MSPISCGSNSSRRLAGNCCQDREKAVTEMSRLGAEMDRIGAIIGPAIGQCCYEVGEEVVDRFRGAGFSDDPFLRKGASVFLDLARANREVIEAAGVKTVTVAGLCTSCRRELFHSARRTVIGQASQLCPTRESGYTEQGGKTMTQDPEDAMAKDKAEPAVRSEPSRKGPGKVVLYAVSILVVAALLVYLETRLPFFRKFMPVVDNKFYIALANIYFLVILLLIFLATRIILKTYIEKKRGIWGSRLKTKTDGDDPLRVRYLLRYPFHTDHRVLLRKYGQMVQREDRGNHRERPGAISVLL